MTRELWCLHIEGPDDVLAAPSREAAQEAAERLQQWLDARPKHELDPLVRCVVEPWPHSELLHTQDLKRWDERTAVRQTEPK